jgi:soluble lytic murein transglycosylase-like protein
MSAAAWRALARDARAARVAQLVDVATARTLVPPAVVLGVARQESDFYPDATATHPGDLARGGAYGLMQMTLQTARTLGYSGPVGDRAQLTGLYDPALNVQLGVLYLSQLLTATRGDVKAAVSAYNGGLSAERPGDAKRTTNDRTAPFINQEYVDKVVKFARSFDVGLTILGVVLLIIGGYALLRRVT